jgi:hypothetical protein
VQAKIENDEMGKQVVGCKIEKIEVKKDGDIMNYWIISTSSKKIVMKNLP